MKIIEKLKNLLRTRIKVKILQVPKVLGQVDNSMAFKLLQKAFNTNNIYLSDMTFDTTSVVEAIKFTKKTSVSKASYQSEGHDCDNFSFALEGYWNEGLVSFATGIIWSKTHAFNCMIDNDFMVWIIEPQTNEFIPFTDARLRDNYFPIQLVVM